jgi:Myb-like DNA-binding domain
VATKGEKQGEAASEDGGQGTAQEMEEGKEEDEDALWASDAEEKRKVNGAKHVKRKRPAPISPPLSPTYAMNLRSSSPGSPSPPLSPPLSPTYRQPSTILSSINSSSLQAAPLSPLPALPPLPPVSTSSPSSLPGVASPAPVPAPAPAPAPPVVQRQAKTMNSSFWTDEELSALRDGVNQFGMDFDAVKKHYAVLFKRRTPPNLREKYACMIDEEEAE